MSCSYVKMDRTRVLELCENTLLTVKKRREEEREEAIFYNLNRHNSSLLNKIFRLKISWTYDEAKEYTINEGGWSAYEFTKYKWRENEKVAVKLIKAIADSNDDVFVSVDDHSLITLK